MKLEFQTLEEVLEFASKFNIKNPIKNDEKPVSIVEVNGKKGVRIRTLDEDFVIDPLVCVKNIKWGEWMKTLDVNHWRGISKKQYAIISAYHDEVNQAIEECGGDMLSDEWSTTECNGSSAWFYYGANGRFYINLKRYACSVRALLA